MGSGKCELYHWIDIILDLCDEILESATVREAGSWVLACDQPGPEAKRTKELVLWKWLIVDEISMVSAWFLSEIDSRLRCAARSMGTMKREADGSKRPFGGLNVIFSGDF